VEAVVRRPAVGADLLRRRAADEPCDGTAEPPAPPDGYLAFRACSAVVGDFAHATVIAARNERWLRMTVSASIRDDNKRATSCLSPATSSARPPGKGSPSARAHRAPAMGKLDRYRDDVAAIQATGTSTGGWVTVTRAADGGFDVTKAPTSAPACGCRSTT